MNKKKKLTINMDATLHKLLKLEAVSRGVTMTELLTEALRSELPKTSRLTKASGDNKKA